MIGRLKHSWRCSSTDSSEQGANGEKKIPNKANVEQSMGNQWVTAGSGAAERLARQDPTDSSTGVQATFA